MKRILLGLSLISAIGAGSVRAMQMSANDLLQAFRGLSQAEQQSFMVQLNSQNQAPAMPQVQVDGISDEVRAELERMTPDRFNGLNRDEQFRLAEAIFGADVIDDDFKAFCVAGNYDRIRDVITDTMTRSGLQPVYRKTRITSNLRFLKNILNSRDLNYARRNILMYNIRVAGVWSLSPDDIINAAKTMTDASDTIEFDLILSDILYLDKDQAYKVNCIKTLMGSGKFAFEGSKNAFGLNKLEYLLHNVNMEITPQYRGGCKIDSVSLHKDLTNIKVLHECGLVDMPYIEKAMDDGRINKFNPQDLLQRVIRGDFDNLGE